MKSPFSALFFTLVSSTLAGAPAVAQAAGTVTAWVRVGEEGQSFTLRGTQLVRYGDGGLRWAAPKSMSGTGVCNNATFGGDPAFGASKLCEVRKTVAAVEQVPGQMPVVNRALIPEAVTGFTEARVRPLTREEKMPGSPWIASPSDVGAFRLSCGSYAKVTNDDPIVFPGEPGRSHLHTFVGNAAVTAASTADSLLRTGGSTCSGGTLNRTAYWMPTMIDTSTGQPIMPTGTNFYYKLGYYGVKAGTVQPFPKGLRMIAGDSRLNHAVGSLNRFACLGKGDGKWHANIPTCGPGGDMIVSVTFPQCWDGKNLDSPDHKSHMAFGTGKGCPADHPVPLPEITQNVHYMPSGEDGATYWRLSSDMYEGPGGYSLHADWFGAWDPATMQKFIDHCINGNMDCHDWILGDDTVVY